MGKDALGEDLLYVGTQEGTLIALKAHQDFLPPSDRLLGSFPPADVEEADPLIAIYGTPALAGGYVIFGAYNGKVYSLDATTPENWDTRIAWEFPTGGPIVGGPVVTETSTGEMLVLVGSSDDRFYALELVEETGQLLERWPPFETEGKIWATPTVAEGIVYFGSLDHKLYALDIETWQAVWAKPFTAEGAFAASPVVVGNRLYVGALDRRLYALNALTGEPVWEQPFEGGNWFWAQPASDGERVYAGNMDGFLYALDAETGRLAWKYDTQGPVMVPPLITETGLLVASDSGRLWFLDRARGEPMSYLDEGGTARRSPSFYDVGDSVRAPLTLGDGTVYLVPMNEQVVALDPERGNPLWIFPTKSE